MKFSASNCIAAGALTTALLLGGCIWNTESDGVHWPYIAAPIQATDGETRKVESMLSKMTLEQKVGQMIQAEVKSITPAEVKEFHIGSILNGGGSIAGSDANGYATLDEWVSMADAYYYASIDSDSGIPVIWGTDSMHGASNIIGATIFPHNIGLGATHNPELLQKIGHATAKETLTSGVDWLFAPTVAVVRDDRWGRTYEAYSEDPEIVSLYASAMVTGIQGDVNTSELFAEDRILANVKHFIGDGGTTGGDDQGNTQISEEELRDIHGPGYFSSIEAGTQVVMASFNSWNGDKVHGNKYLLTDVLKVQMGFEGLLVSDWNAHGQVEGCSNVSCPQSINAGVDMVMVPTDWKAFYYNTIDSVRSGDIPMSRIDDAVSRILRVKLRSNLFDRGAPSARRLSGDHNTLGSSEHRALARSAVRQSLVLLKNQNKILPLSPQQNVLVVGAADDIGKTAGGWTVTWQGITNDNSSLPGATSIWSGIESAVKAAGGTATLSESGAFETKPDVAIVVFGENPYAEMQGDLVSLEYQAGFHSDLQILNRLKAQGIPVVSVFVSGRPMVVNSELNASDAFIASWLLGSEGAGVADVLFTHQGEINFDFTGKLTFSWPENINQTRLNRHDELYEPLFPYGFGLTYQSSAADSVANTANLNDTPEKHTNKNGIVELFVGRPLAPWQLLLTNDSESKSLRSLIPQSIAGASSTAMDKDIQGDTKLIAWTNQASIGLFSDVGFDLQAYADAGYQLQLDLLVNTLPTTQARIGAVMNGLTQTIPLELPKVGEWTTITIPMTQFGTDFRNTTSPFLIQGSSGSIAVANVRLIQ